MSTYQIYRKHPLGGWQFVQRVAGKTKAAALRVFRSDWPEYRRTKLQARMEARNMARKQKNTARRVKRNTGWIKAKAVKILKKAGGYIVKVRR